MHYDQPDRAFGILWDIVLSLGGQQFYLEYFHILVIKPYEVYLLCYQGGELTHNSGHRKSTLTGS
jgi:hypothetical protein